MTTRIVTSGAVVGAIWVSSRRLSHASSARGEMLSGLVGLSRLLFGVLLDAPGPAIARAEDLFGRITGALGGLSTPNGRGVPLPPAPVSER